MSTICSGRRVVKIVCFGGLLFAAQFLCAQDQEVELEARVGNKPLVVVACSSPVRTDEDTAILTNIVSTINTMGSYRAVLTQSVFLDGVLPNKNNIMAIGTNGDAVYVVTEARSRQTNGINQCTISLWDMKTGFLVGKNMRDYVDADEFTPLAQMIISQLFFLIPTVEVPLPPEDVSWKNGYLYTSPVLGMVIRRYTGHQPYDGISFTVGMAEDWQWLILRSVNLGMSLGFELDFTLNYSYVGYENADGSTANGREEYMAPLLEAPLLFKINWYPAFFMLQMETGIYFQLPLANLEMVSPTSMIGGIIGLRLGRKWGPGIASLHMRCGWDLGESRFLNNPYNEFTRFSIMLGGSYHWINLKRPQKKLIPAEHKW
ncbi:MAG: hypothetical protein LBR16_03295 [Treponema sp.]|jgi:hypothetical protein|nr:hypothetical protein [Treponema sp.]